MDYVSRLAVVHQELAKGVGERRPADVGPAKAAPAGPVGLCPAHPVSQVVSLGVERRQVVGRVERSGSHGDVFSIDQR